MAEGTYEYECMRAELLGVDQPDYEEFLQRKREAEENQRLAAEVEEEALDATNLEVAEAQGEALKSTGGKLDELNSILSATQKRLDRFKVRCGSVTELIKTRIGGSMSGSSDACPAAVGEDAVATAEAAAASEVGEIAKVAETANAVAPGGEQRSELTRAMENNTDKLDSMLSKAERAHIALNNQNARIKKLLK